ncbi:hypothetical protein BB560_001741, partial [Smittium megazygosporum]
MEKNKEGHRSHRNRANVEREHIRTSSVPPIGRFPAASKKLLLRATYKKVSVQRELMGATCQNTLLELQQTKSVAVRNRTSDLPDPGRTDEPKGCMSSYFLDIVRRIHTHDNKQ